MKRSNLEMLFSEKLTENADKTYNTTGNLMLDILFMSEFYRNNLNKAPSIGTSDKSKLFAMFIRDPRFGLGQRDLGRHLMAETELSLQDMVYAGRYDDLLIFFRDGYKNDATAVKAAQFLVEKASQGNRLAKKWLPRFGGKDDAIAKEIARIAKLSPKQYRQLIKEDSTVEYKMTHNEEINYEHVPSLAMIKYFQAFKRRDEDGFGEYLDAVERGEKELHVATTTVYDIYRNRDKIDPDLFIDKIEKIAINAIPILDTSSSMMDMNDSFGKAMAIAHYLAKFSTYAPNQVISFSSQPQLMTISDKPSSHRRSRYAYGYDFGDSHYGRELNSMYTGDISNTDFGAVMQILSGLEEYPEYLVVLSDMEFDYGSAMSKDETMKVFKEHGAKTKIVWWNFNSRATTVPETDNYGNIYMSGYSPQLLKFLEVGFDGNQFLDKLLEEYAKTMAQE